MEKKQYPHKEDEQQIASEPSATWTGSTYDSVISYLRSHRLPIETKRAVCHQLQTEVADENLSYLKHRLTEFSLLEKGWDGYGEALPISSHIISNVRQVLDACKPTDLLEWRLFPNVNGTLLMELDAAAISIGEDSFTYWAESMAKDLGEENVPFSVTSVVDAIKRINAYV